MTISEIRFRSLDEARDFMGWLAAARVRSDQPSTGWRLLYGATESRR